jgi:hypothetical protein
VSHSTRARRAAIGLYQRALPSALVDMNVFAHTPIDAPSNGRRRQASDGEQLHGSAAARARKQFSDDMTATLRTNTLLNLCVRAGLATIGLAAGASALVYTWWRGDEFADAIAGKSADAPGDLLAVTMPFLLFVLVSALAGVAAGVAHARSLEETSRTLEALNRIEREGEVAVSARGLIFSFEEKLQNARRAFTLQLWLGRTMFLVCLGLLAATLITAMSHDGLVTVATGAGSVFAALLGVTKRAPHNVGRHLADVVQIQSIITGCDRQISLLESAALAALKHDADPTTAHRFVLEAQSRIDEVVDRAVIRIEDFADPGVERDSARHARTR